MQKKQMALYTFISLCMINFVFCGGKQAQKESDSKKDSLSDEVRVGAAQTAEYFPLLQGKRIAVVGNHSSLIQSTHLVDTLLAAGLDLRKVFSPEHGFRGEADAGAMVSSSIDEKTALPIISLYGNNKKPTKAQLADVDIILFDIQDVGARFYTYISTLHYLMQACAENNIPLIVLDRPNPNGFYVDGPVLKTELQSFVGMHEVPVVHGMTVGEYAGMINGENWLGKKLKCDLKVIKVQNYDHSYQYSLPVKPSPNLPNMLSVYLYPSLCFFEGTSISVGRGTNYPFQQIGHPSLREFEHSFTPESMTGATDPPLEGKKCFGIFFNADSLDNWMEDPKIDLNWLLQLYHAYDDKEEFFNNYFNTLAGNTSLKEKIQEGLSAGEIRKSWEDELKTFKSLRKKYLLYNDF